MSRTQMINRLARTGMDSRALEAAPDEALAEVFRFVEQREQRQSAQAEDIARVRQYVDAHRAQLDAIRPGNADEVLRSFSAAIRAGAKAKDLLP